MTLGIRPQHIHPAPDGHGFEVTVNATEQLGSESFLYCTLPAGQPLNLHAPGQTPLRRRERIRVGVEAGACRLFRTTAGELALRRLRG